MNEKPGNLTEFVDGKTGLCGETALAFADAAATDGHDSEQGIIDILNDMLKAGLTKDPNGSSTLWAIAREAERKQQKIALEWDYAEPFPHDWHSVLLANAGVKPIVIEVANGQALKDAETGSGENASNLHYHFICILGKQTDGYVVGDGDNFQATSRYQVYSYATLEAAKPCGLLMLEARQPAPPPPPAPDPKDAEIAALKAQVAQLQAQLANATPPELHNALSDVSNLLAPFAAAQVEVVAVMKKLGY